MFNRELFNVRTRSSEMSLVVNRVKGMIGKSTFRFSGAVEWNKLPTSTQSILDKTLFKKTFLILRNFLLTYITVVDKKTPELSNNSCSG